MGKGNFSPGPSPSFKTKSGWLDKKLVMGFFTVVAVGLILLTTSYVPLEGLGHFDLSSRQCDCDNQLKALQLEHQIEEHMRKTSSERDVSVSRMQLLKASTQIGSRKSIDPPKKPEIVKEIVKEIVREWQLPAVAHDREWEKLQDKKYGVPRRFVPLGTASFLFVQFGAYRGSPNSFAVVGLGPKPLHVHGNPGFECSWESARTSQKVKGNATKYLPDWGYGKQYTVVVVNCTFESDVGADNNGGQLSMVATHGSWDSTGLEDVKYVALTEEQGEYDVSVFEEPYKFDYLYCGSPLYGAISPQKIREWISYHIWLFGPRSHFMLYDAGGIHDEVRLILGPWVKLGRITVMNIRQEMRYDTYYYNQFLVVNDCLFRAKSLAKWTFFFDVDEFVHVPWYFSFDYVMSEVEKLGRKATQVVFDQKPVSHKHCSEKLLQSNPDGNISRLWTMEKLTYRRTQITEPMGFMDRKFAIQAKYALSAGVHRSEDLIYPMEGMNLEEAIHYEDWRLHYFHYHNTINNRQDVCQEFLDASYNVTQLEGVWHEFDETMVPLAATVREFELDNIGRQPFIP